MKLRIQESKITLRLQSDEILRLQERGKLTQSTSIPGAPITISLELKAIGEVSVHYSADTFAFSFPESNLVGWENADKIGFSQSINGLLVTIEKDLPRRSSVQV